MRSVRTRMMLISLTIAIVAVGATAWVVNRTTSSGVREAVERDEKTEATIYEALSFYAFTNASWDGVEPLVESLAAKFEQRIALTTVEGEPIVDSEDLLGDNDAPLPAAPAAFIDPDSPVISFAGALDFPAELNLGDLFGALPFGGIEQFNEEADALAEALEEAGVPYALTVDEFGIRYPKWDEGDPVAAAVVDRFFRESIGDISVGPFGVGALELEELNAQIEDLALFLEEQGVPFDFGTGPSGLSFLDFDPTAPDFDEALGKFFAQFESEFTFDSIPFLAAGAEPALLFLGYGEADLIPDPIGWELLVAVALVALIAVGVTIIASRRVLAPIGALTRAARNMEAGDLTERVEVEGDDELAHLAGAFNAMAASIDEQDRMRRTMTSDIAHELRTPLSNVRGYLEAIQEGVAEPTPDLLESLHEEVLQLQHLIDDLQNLSLAESGRLRVQRRSTDLSALLTQTADTWRHRAGRVGVEIEVVSADPLTVLVDPERIRQVISNLLDNAVRHTDAGGTVRLALRRAGEEAVVTVADSGEGIAAEHLPHLFDRFYRADESRSRETGGSGLGLAITAQLVSLHRGRIDVESTVGEGTTFTVRLPIGPDAG